MSGLLFDVFGGNSSPNMGVFGVSESLIDLKTPLYPPQFPASFAAEPQIIDYRFFFSFTSIRMTSCRHIL